MTAASTTAITAIVARQRRNVEDNSPTPSARRRRYPVPPIATSAVGARCDRIERMVRDLLRILDDDLGDEEPN